MVYPEVVSGTVPEVVDPYFSFILWSLPILKSVMAFWALSSGYDLYFFFYGIPGCIICRET